MVITYTMRVTKFGHCIFLLVVAVSKSQNHVCSVQIRYFRMVHQIGLKSFLKLKMLKRLTFI